MPAPLSLPPIKIQCVIDANVRAKLVLQGVIPFETAKKQNEQQTFDYGFFLFDAKEKTRIKTVDEGFASAFQVSPDRKHLAYTHDDASQNQPLVIMDSHGNVVVEYPLFFDGMWWDYFNWQNSEQMRIVRIDFKEISGQLLNPFTQEHISLKTQWPGGYVPADPHKVNVLDWELDAKANGAFYAHGTNILYDPTLTRVVYPKEAGVVSLVDVETGVELASARFVDWGRLSSWSPSGEYLVIVNQEGNAEEFYLVSKDGPDFQRITDFSKKLKNASVLEYSWSPDSRRIAFWLNTEAGEPQDGAQSELAVLDIASKRVTRLCIQGISKNAYEPWMMNQPEPVWSPEGRYLMITQWDNPAAPTKYYVVVIDAVTGLTEKISENTAPIGWMVSEP